jgi:hypothetical protein
MLGLKTSILVYTNLLTYLLTYGAGRAIAQAVSRWLPTAAARVRSSGICDEQSGVGACFLRVFRCPLPILHHHNHLGQDISGRRAEWTQSDSTPLTMRILFFNVTLSFTGNTTT